MFQIIDKKAAYYLVAIPEGDIAVKGKTLQEKYSRQYGIYRKPYPPLHLTVGILSFPLHFLEQLNLSLEKVIRPFLPLQLKSTRESCFPDPHKSINLALEHSASLTALSAEVIRTVTAAGFSAEPFDQWDYHISLVNCYYAFRAWSNAEYRKACRELAEENLCLEGCTRRLELWDPKFPPLKVLTRLV